MLHRLSHTRLLRDINVLVLVTAVKEMTCGRVRAVGRSSQCEGLGGRSPRAGFGKMPGLRTEVT